MNFTGHLVPTSLMAKESIFLAIQKIKYKAYGRMGNLSNINEDLFGLLCLADEKLFK